MRVIVDGRPLVPPRSGIGVHTAEIAGRLDQLTFKYTGPWPPYNFVNIRLKLEPA